MHEEETAKKKIRELHVGIVFLTSNKNFWHLWQNSTWKWWLVPCIDLKGKKWKYKPCTVDFKKIIKIGIWKYKLDEKVGFPREAASMRSWIG